MQHHSMDWHKLITAQRLGMEHYVDDKARARSEFQRDYDRLIFSAPFRRLQNKTQVFPLPGSVFVHNRLTHSLEVSCVGRSLGNVVSKELQRKYNYGSNNPLEHIESIVSAACLAHDLGNPPFGHSGEKAISTFFSEVAQSVLQPQIESCGGRWSDLTCFEGNANSIRLLTHQFSGRREGGFVLTYSTLASIVKYPYSSLLAQPKSGKFGFFFTEEEQFAAIASGLQMIRHDNVKEFSYARHPLVYLVEAADDICYQMMDIEDALKLHILDIEEVENLLLQFIPYHRIQRVKEVMNKIGDPNEKVAYLRSSAIGNLIEQCVQAFVSKEEEILQGKLTSSLIKNIDEVYANAYRNCSTLAQDKIYRSSSVLDVELAGYKIIHCLLEAYIDAVLNPSKAYSKILLARVPSQYQLDAPNIYLKTMAVLDFISGMTDVYALDLYQKIQGTNLPIL